MNKEFIDFFAGIGLVQYGLEQNGWKHCLSIDHSTLKKNGYLEHFGKKASNSYINSDVINVSGKSIPEVFLAHASFPCTDVSAAGSREGSQDGRESSAIDSFLRIIGELGNQSPAIVMLENVKGLINSHNGNDLHFLIQRLNKLNYAVDLLCIDAKHFVPQSRERVFIIGHHKSYTRKADIKSLNIDKLVCGPGRNKAVLNFINENKQLDWLFLPLPTLPTSKTKLNDLIDKKVNWWPEHRSKYLYSQMFERHKEWINKRISSQRYEYATAFRRMRIRDGQKQSTAELRTDGIAGCLRTAKGGSAKQIVLRVGKGRFDARLLSSKECSRLMGANKYKITKALTETEWLFCFGDAVCVDVITWLDLNYLSPIYEKYSQLDREFDTTPKYKEINMKLPQNTIKHIEKQWSLWMEEHNDKKSDLPIKGRVYGALIVLNNIENEVWSLEELGEAKTTDKGLFFTDRSIKNHTNHRIGLILSERGYDYLIPKGGEQGRTSTGTKRAGLDLIKLIHATNKKFPKIDISTILDFLFNKAIKVLQKYNLLGGIDINYNSNETISSFIKRILKENLTNPGAVYQHMVGAKLHLRYENSNLEIVHHGSNTADVQTGRLGDFEIGSTIFHVTKTPNKDHRKKALLNANAGYKTYLLVPSKLVSAQEDYAESENLGTEFINKVEVFSIEQFITQNIDEIAVFDKYYSRFWNLIFIF